eukprot:scaffold147130_cov50-Prasinocladus_malaysianus.AAC.1
MGTYRQLAVKEEVHAASNAADGHPTDPSCQQSGLPGLGRPEVSQQPRLHRKLVRLNRTTSRTLTSKESERRVYSSIRPRWSHE